MPRKLFVTKADGSREPFDVEKVKRTALRAGADDALADNVAEEVEKRAYDGISTHIILEIALKMLDKMEPSVAARYDLKGAIMRLGPAGFIFEQLLAEMLRAWGWKTKVHSMLKGKCVSHEVDVVAEKGDERAMIEAKYHNQPGIFTGIKDALYVVARFEDLVAAKTKESFFTEPWLATNTKFSGDVIQYAECRGLKLLGWKYPVKENIQFMLERKMLYPVTVIRNIDKLTLQKLADAELMFCSDLLVSTKELFRKTGIKENRLAQLQQIAKSVCQKQSA
ncbi:MAG: ATP cone domain-containing protein [Candidatus Aenigmatarchaeota archaeon]